MHGKMQRAALLMILILTWQAASWAQKGAPVVADHERERRSFAQNLVKAINAAAADYRKEAQRFPRAKTAFGNDGTKARLLPPV
jgi:hypothetical protein